MSEVTLREIGEVTGIVIVRFLVEVRFESSEVCELRRVCWKAAEDCLSRSHKVSVGVYKVYIPFGANAVPSTIQWRREGE